MNTNLNNLIRLAASSKAKELEKAARELEERRHSLISELKFSEYAGAHKKPAYLELEKATAENDRARDLERLRRQIIADAIARELTAIYKEWVKDNSGRPFWHKRTQKAINEFLTAEAGAPVTVYADFSTINAYIQIGENYYERLKAEYIGSLRSEWDGAKDNYYTAYNPDYITRQAVNAENVESAALAAYNAISKQAEIIKNARRELRAIYNEIVENYGLHDFITSDGNPAYISNKLITIKL